MRIKKTKTYGNEVPFALEITGDSNKVKELVSPFSKRIRKRAQVVK